MSEASVSVGVPAELHLTKNRKVTPVGSSDTERTWAQIPNSLGLPAGDSCPGKTEFCNSCYAVEIEGWSNVYKAMHRNLDALQEAGSVEGMQVLLTDAISRYEKSADKHGIADKDKVFRIHWDGDFFSEDYAQAWANTMREFPDINFWAYTRSFVEPVNVIPTLAPVENLILYLSVDEYNQDEAYKVLEEYPDLPLAGCADDYESARELLSGRRSIVCPENKGKLPLMKEGKGACIACRYCVDDRGDVLFAVSKQEFSMKHRQSELAVGEVAIQIITKPDLLSGVEIVIDEEGTQDEIDFEEPVIELLPLQFE